MKELDILTTAMEIAGFQLIDSKVGPMDSGIAEFSNGKRIISIIKDRSQWFLKGTRQKLEPLGLWRVFNDTLEFREALLGYISN